MSPAAGLLFRSAGRSIFKVAEVGLRFEANLVSLVLDDLGDDLGRMPLLQHTLRELWRRRRGVWLKTAELPGAGRRPRSGRPNR